MFDLSRRAFLGGVAAVPFALWLPRLARGSELRIRHDIASPEGAAMLQVYADAVARMQARTADDPLSWTWWWYTHFVDGTKTKADEITRIFGTEPSASSLLASEMWNTCQSHSGQNPNHFMVWHRMYVFFLEDVVREVSGHPEFTMPYWNYTSPDPAQRAVLPPQFLLPGDPVYGSLFRRDRTRLANSGQSIQANQPVDVMDISAAMATTSYSNVGKVQGFCRAIDSGVHSRIHVLVGTAKNMGKVPYSARDPLFGVHHANIDRIWASWNAAGNVNPVTAPWAKTEFVFVDRQGQRVSVAMKDFFDIATLGYAYDALIPPAANATSLARASTSTGGHPARIPAERIADVRGGAELAARTTRVTLLPVAGTRPQARVLGLGTAQDGRRTYLVVKDLHAWDQPEVLYHLYLVAGTPSAGAAPPRLDRDAYIGSINFFDAEFHDHGHGAMGDLLGENFYSFDVTAVLQAIGRAGNAHARDRLSLAFVPAGTPNPSARPLVASIELVRQ